MTTPPSLNLIPQVVDPSTKELIPRGRVKSPKDLVSAYQSLFNADRESSRQRALVQAQVDGQPPYSESSERLRNLHGRANVNWGLADQGLSEAVMPYNDILEAIDKFAHVPTSYGNDEQTRTRFSEIISDELTRMLRTWDDFYDLWEQNTLLFNQEGLSFAFFDDDCDWRWKVYGQQFFKFPRRVRASVNATDLFAAKIDMMPHELFSKIRNPDAAKEAGWKPEEVRAALKTATPHGIPTNDPQEWERAWKDNDIIFGITSATVETVQAWVRELDGSVSHYICRADGQGDWLYCSMGKYRSIKRMVIAYKGNIGTNGDFQSIRGWGQKSFSSSSGINRLLCKLLDMAVHTATPVLQCDSEDSLTDQAMQQWGPYIKMASGVTFAEQKMPALDQTLIPALQSLQDVHRMRSSSYAPMPANQMSSRTQKTKYQVQTETEQNGKLTSASMNRFFKSWGDHFKEFVRRVINPDYTQDDPGGHEVWEFRRRCVKKGVPLEAIYEVDVDGIEVNMGFGKGSVSERRATISALEEDYYKLDRKGQKDFTNLKFSAYLGTTLANRLAPVAPDRVPNDEVHTALSENNQASVGQPIYVLDDDDHPVHLNAHLTRLFEINDQLTNLQIQLEEGIPQMLPIWEHAGEHLQYMDPMNPVAKEFKEALQQLGEVVTNGQKELDAEAKRAAKEQGMTGEEAEPGYGGMNASTYKQAVQAQQSLQQLDLDAAKQRQQLDFDAKKRTIDLVARDAKFAQDIKHRREMMLLDAQQKRTKPAA